MNTKVPLTVYALLQDFGLSSVKRILIAAMPVGTRTDRVKARAYADGYARAVQELTRAISCIELLQPVETGSANAAQPAKLSPRWKSSCFPKGQRS